RTSGGQTDSICSIVSDAVLPLPSGPAMATLLSNIGPMVTPGVDVHPGIDHDWISAGCCAAAGAAAPNAQIASTAASGEPGLQNDISPSLTSPRPRRPAGAAQARPAE